MARLSDILRLPPTLNAENAKPALELLLAIQLNQPPGSLLFNAVDRCTRALAKVLSIQSLWVPGQELRTSANSEAMREVDEEFETVIALLKEGGYMATNAEQQQ